MSFTNLGDILKLDFNSSLVSSSALMLAKNLTTCPSVLDTNSIKSRSRNSAAANVQEKVTAVVLAVPRGAATTTLGWSEQNLSQSVL